MSLGWQGLTPEGQKFFDELERLTKLEVTVGFQHDESYPDTGETVADIASYNEFGTSTIPPRPFMKQSFENHERELQDACDQVQKTIYNGGTAEEGLETLGVYVKGLVQEEIVEGEFEPNKESTIRKKKSSQPLIDTGTMRQSVTYVIKEAE